LLLAVPLARMRSSVPLPLGRGCSGLLRLALVALRSCAARRRWCALVRAVSVSGPGARFFGFVLGPCPRSVSPSASSSRCFCGGGSGSWASLAFAVGLGLPVVVFWCGSGAPALPSWWGGSWSPVSVGGVSGFQFVPAQLSFF
jgi:hypothetical protein